MYQLLELESPLDRNHLKVAVPDVEQVQFDKPLTNDDYMMLAQVLEQHPNVTLRAYGFSKELAGLEFLRLFPNLRRISVSHLMLLSDVSPLNLLSDDLEYLDVGETKKALDLTPLKFSRLSTLRVVGHDRGLSELVARNRQLHALALWRLRFDQALRQVSLPDVESLALTLGSLQDATWLGQFSSLRFLAMRRVRNVSNLTALQQLAKLEWLWLEAMQGIASLPDLSPNRSLRRVELDGLRGLSTPHAIAGLAQAPHLDELLIGNTPLPAEAFGQLVEHPSLSALSVALGSQSRDREIKRLIDKPEAQTYLQAARTRNIPFFL